MKKLRDILNDAIEKNITYPEAKEELKKLKLSQEDFEQYDIMLYKLLGDEDKISHAKIYTLPMIPNEMFATILRDTMKRVRDEQYTPEICQALYETYGISSSLMNYFVNEAIHIVRMNTLAPEEILSIGQSYHNAVKFVEENAAKGKKVKLKFKVPNQKINAEQASDIILHECEEE